MDPQEPRDGVFAALRAWRSRDRQRVPLDGAEHRAIVAAAVLRANAILSFAYTEDEIMSFAGRLFFVATAAVGVATAQITAFYPLLPDLGAYAVITRIPRA